ncbi:alpha-1-acid glycoprotein-like isoform X1 [Sorex araneus]|uniref:alpha-1-acid glycoprotein-like isoform X1 n=1 Tax=Sorex araneus TaxID=42254 RepID=UPI002433A56C|nr:alpha-1-acid glycoprotein-like isoform X1 [Sorex araneus]
MALLWALAVLSLLPLVGAESPECANMTGTPLTNATLEMLSGKWFFIASAFRHPEYNQWAKMVPSIVSYYTYNQTENVVYFRAYITQGDKCVYNASHIDIQRENGTLSVINNGVKYFSHVVPTKDPSIYMFAFHPEDKEKIGLSLYANTSQVTPEQMSEFHGALKCLGLEVSEIITTDETKSLCGPLEQQHEEERKKKLEEAAQA